MSGNNLAPSFDQMKDDLVQNAKKASQNRVLMRKREALEEFVHDMVPEFRKRMKTIEDDESEILWKEIRDIEDENWSRRREVSKEVASSHTSRKLMEIMAPIITEIPSEPQPPRLPLTPLPPLLREPPGDSQNQTPPPSDKPTGTPNERHGVSTNSRREGAPQSPQKLLQIVAQGTSSVLEKKADEGPRKTGDESDPSGEIEDIPNRVPVKPRGSGEIVEDSQDDDETSVSTSSMANASTGSTRSSRRTKGAPVYNATQYYRDRGI